MAWTIKLLDSAKRDLRKLDKDVADRILDFLQYRVARLEHPRDVGEPLTGTLGGYWRYRVGDYRVICRFEDGELVVLVVKVGHRSKIYR